MPANNFFHSYGLKVTPFRNHHARDKQFSSKRNRGGSHADFLFEMMNVVQKFVLKNVSMKLTLKFMISHI